MTILCIDFGLKRIGLAVGSTDSGIAFARNILINDGQLFEHLKLVVDRDRVEKFLVGSPIKQDGEAGDIDPQLQQFLSKLENFFGLPVMTIDERFTSKMAAAKLSQHNISAKEQKSTVDSIAAQIMLQEWLDLQQK